MAFLFIYSYTLITLSLLMIFDVTISMSMIIFSHSRVKFTPRTDIFVDFKIESTSLPTYSRANILT